MCVSFFWDESLEIGDYSGGDDWFLFSLFMVFIPIFSELKGRLIREKNLTHDGNK